MTDTLLILARIGLGAVFLAAGVAKLIDRAEFEKHLPAFGVKWPGVARGMSYGLPVVEAVVGLMLITGLFVNVAVLVAIALLAAFTLVVMVALVRRTSVSCGCFGNIGQGRVTGMTLARNVGLLALVAIMMAIPVPVADPVVASFTLGTTLSLVILLATQYFGLKPYFLELPVSPYQSSVRWSYVDSSAQYRTGRFRGRFNGQKRWV